MAGSVPATSQLASGLTWLARDRLQRQSHLGVGGDREGLGVGMESRDHHVGHVHLLGRGRTNAPYIQALASFFLTHRLSAP